MISLAEDETVMKELMDFRFEDPDGDGMDVHGHNLGNLILTALTQQRGSFLEAIQTIGQVLNVKGTIVPATTQVITLFARMEDGVIVKGEASIPNVNNHIREVFYDEEVKADPEAVQAILDAELIIYGVGSVYTSILPNVIIPEICDALKETTAKRVYICNAMTQPGETDGYSVEDHVDALLHHGAPVDAVLVPSDILPYEIVSRYFDEGSTPVMLKYQKHEYEVIQKSLLNFDRKLVRHDTQKVAEAIESILEEL